MAAKRHSKTTTTKAKRPTQQQLARIGAQAVELFKERAGAVSPHEVIAVAEAELTEPRVIPPEDLKRITGLLGRVMFSCEAINAIATEASHAPLDDFTDAEWLLTSIQDSAKINARRIEVIHSLLTGEGEYFGNFGDEFNVPARRANMGVAQG